MTRFVKFARTSDEETIYINPESVISVLTGNGHTSIRTHVGTHNISESLKEVVTALTDSNELTDSAGKHYRLNLLDFPARAS